MWRLLVTSLVHFLPLSLSRRYFCSSPPTSTPFTASHHTLLGRFAFPFVVGFSSLHYQLVPHSLLACTSFFVVTSVWECHLPYVVVALPHCQLMYHSFPAHPAVIRGHFGVPPFKHFHIPLTTGMFAYSILTCALFTIAVGFKLSLDPLVDVLECLELPNDKLYPMLTSLAVWTHVRPRGTPVKLLLLLPASLGMSFAPLLSGLKPPWVGSPSVKRRLLYMLCRLM